jgi:hypothetical protein
MLNKKDSLATLKAFFKKNKIAKVIELFILIKTKSRMTIFRRLSELKYLSSYTHAGSYYTLPNIPNFDSSGLWYFNEIGFSQNGNLKETLIYLIEKSESGKTHDELEMQLHVRVQNALLDLIHSNKICRTKIANIYLYTVRDATQAKKQIQYRKNHWREHKDINCPDWIVIQILSAVIRINSVAINIDEIILELKSRQINITFEQVENVLDQLHLKKTLVSK